MRFSVEIQRVRYDYVRVEVEADNYSEAGTKALCIVRPLEDAVRFVPVSHRRNEFNIVSTDKR